MSVQTVRKAVPEKTWMIMKGDLLQAAATIYGSSITTKGNTVVYQETIAGAVDKAIELLEEIRSREVGS